MPCVSNAKSVLVAMSGGVDSAVAAWLLLQQGMHVEALFLRLVRDHYTDDACMSARMLSERLGIRFHELDYSDTFREKVVRYFVNSYSQGLTPNPCVLCNPRIKIAAGFKVMKELGLSMLATGHYARVVQGERDRSYRLLRGSDRAKDQSYFLHGIDRDHLQYLLFPLGSMLKADVIETGERAGLSSMVQSESQDVCFLRGDYRMFLKEHGVENRGPGEMVDIDGCRVGVHKGLQNYTVGQRKGLGLPGPAPSYVIRVEMDANRLVVGPEDALYTSTFQVRHVNWLVSDAAHSLKLRCQVKIRYRHTPADATVYVHEGPVHVKFDQPQRAVTPGQFAVFYDGDTVLGGGEICA